MTSLWWIGAVFVAGILSTLIVQWSRDAWPKRRNYVLPGDGDRTWPKRGGR